MKKLSVLWCIVIAALPSMVFAQQKSYGNGNHGNSGFGMAQNGQVIGKIVDQTSNKGVGFATVGVLHAKDSSVVTGVLSQDNGDFTISQIPVGKYILRINYIGYNTIYKDFSITPRATSQDLGNFKISPSSALLKTVKVTANAPAYSMQLDKKVFDVSKSLTSVGGDATDVLQQVPGVNVDVDGNVTLRNGSPTIYVDGKTTLLTLDEIPAEDIAKIEVITNPSSKYPASGQAGIINIILKKNRKPGINGMLRAGADTRGGNNVGGNVSVYQNPLNVTLSYFRHQRNNPETTTLTRNNLFNNTFLDQNTDGKNNGSFQMGRLGIDYFLDNRNTLSFDGGIGGGSFNTSQSVFSKYLDGDKNLDSTGQSQTLSERQFRFLSGDLSFKHNFQKEGHTLTADVRVSKFNSPPTTSTVQTQYFDNTGKPMPGNIEQKIINAGPGRNFTGQLDYVNPLTDKSKLEAGLRASLRNSSSTNDMYNLDGSGNYVYDSLLSTDFNYKESIYAAYAQYSDQLGKFGYQLGLRAEDYTYSGSIPSKGLSFKPESDKLGLYPTVFLTYKFSDYDQLQLNYTRRVDRPRFWQRFPYINYSNPLALTKGNPDLKPEYTNSFELNYSKIIGQTNFMVSLYYRNTDNMITTYTEPYNNSADTTISYSINANSNNVYGGEFTVQTQFTNWWNVTGDFNLFQTDINANVKSQNFSNSKFSWFGKVTSDMKLPADFSLQLQGNYNAPVPTPQGTTSEFGFVDIGIKKDFLKKKNLTATLTLTDIFNTREREFDYTIPNVFIQNSIEKRASRMLKLNLSYTFGKQDFSLFKRIANKSQQGAQQGGQDMQQGGQY